MNGRAIAGAALAQSGLGALADGFPGARPEMIRIDPALAIAGAAAEARAQAGPVTTAEPGGQARATRP